MDVVITVPKGLWEDWLDEGDMTAPPGALRSPRRASLDAILARERFVADCRRLDADPLPFLAAAEEAVRLDAERCVALLRSPVSIEDVLDWIKLRIARGEQRPWPGVEEALLLMSACIVTLPNHPVGCRCVDCASLSAAADCIGRQA